MTQKASEVLTLQAFKLQQKYRKLLELIQDLSQNAHVGIVKNQLRAILQYHCIYQLHGYKEIIDGITGMDEVFKFLIKNRFVGYLNYYLLKELSSEVICGDGYKKAQAEVVEYEKHYCKFIEEPSFCHLIEVFDENPHVNPSTVIGLPIVIITLSKKWKSRNKKDLNGWVPFLEENKHLLQSIGYKCILITYAIFPVHLLEVMSFLSDKEHMKRLKVNGITIETPSYTMKMTERLREVPTEKSVEEGKGEMQSQQFVLLKKIVTSQRRESERVLELESERKLPTKVSSEVLLKAFSNKPLRKTVSSSTDSGYSSQINSPLSKY
uniref:Uncharacterized protein n=1 Tax=Amphimedon queenslandica TaxID=400682 RepID=A0A1X7SSU8_AMPQE